MVWRLPTGSDAGKCGGGVHHENLSLSMIPYDHPGHVGRWLISGTGDELCSIDGSRDELSGQPLPAGPTPLDRTGMVAGRIRRIKKAPTVHRRHSGATWPIDLPIVSRSIENYKEESATTSTLLLPSGAKTRRLERSNRGRVVIWSASHRGTWLGTSLDDVRLAPCSASGSLIARAAPCS